MKKNCYPVLEFDSDSENYISAENLVDPHIKLPRRCVITFLGDALKKIVNEKRLKTIGKLKLESIILPIYKWESENGKEVALLHGLGGGPYAAGQIEKLVAMGCKQFMICGGCGVLYESSTPNEIFVPTIALRDEGTSYHYVRPSREIAMKKSIRNKIINYLSSEGIQFRCVKTWTTDAMYRETFDLIKARREENCDVVDMECASFFAVAQYKKVDLGQIFYGGDDLSGKKWDSRNWKQQTNFRIFLLELSLQICGEL